MSAHSILGCDAAQQRRTTMQTIILTSLLGTVLATSALAGSTGSTITVRGFVDRR
jgi:hypothetical protein